jgi:tetratricopeptide (TPR) repeat protein
LILVVAWLGGCAAVTDRLEPIRPLADPPATADQAIATAQGIASEGRWSDALAYLDAAALSVADVEGMQAARAEIELNGQRARGVLKDRMLAADAENLHLRVELLKALAIADPDDLLVAARRIYARQQVENMRPSLVTCAETQMDALPKLARRCLDSATAASPTPAETERLSAVDTHLRAITAADNQRRSARERSRRQALVRTLLDKVRVSIQQHDYRSALDRLDEVARMQPGNPEIARLQQQANDLLTPQVEALLRLGDHLYLDEQLDAAIGAWQAALTLQPDDSDIQARIERAKTVLENLESLRLRQERDISR